MNASTSRAVVVSEDHYIFPPRTKDSTPRSELAIYASLGWQAQLKYNDSHALIKYKSDGSVELWNRHAERFRTYTAPDWLLEQLNSLRPRLRLQPGTWTLLDGGVLDHKHVAIRDTIVIWDVLVYNGQHLVGTTYQHRYNLLFDHLIGNGGNGAAQATPWFYVTPKGVSHDFGTKIHDNLLMPRNYDGILDPAKPVPGDAWDALWTGFIDVVNTPWTIGKPGDRNYDCKPLIEGLVVKNMQGKLKMGFKEANNQDWLIKSRVQTGRHRF